VQEEVKDSNLAESILLAFEDVKRPLTTDEGNKKKLEAQVYEFDLKNIPLDISLGELKKIFEGFHVFDFKVDDNKINNFLKGTGRFKLRTTDKEDIGKLRKNLKQNGMVLLNRIEKS